MSDKNKDNVKIALGLGAVLVGAAVLYRIFSSGNKTVDENESEHQETDGDVDDEPDVENLNEEEIQAKIQADKALVEAAKKANGQLVPELYLKSLAIVGSLNKETMKEYKDYWVKKRREALKAKNDEEYRKIVIKLMQSEDEQASRILELVLSELNIDQVQFQQMHMQFANNPQTAEMVMAAQQGKLTQPASNEPPKISRQQTLDHLKRSETHTISQLKEAQKEALTMKQPETEAEAMEMMIDVMVKQSKQQDQMYFDAGEEFENEEFEKALMYYYTRDPAVKMKLEELQHRV